MQLPEWLINIGYPNKIPIPREQISNFGWHVICDPETGLIPDIKIKEGDTYLHFGQPFGVNANSSYTSNDLHIIQGLTYKNLAERGGFGFTTPRWKIFRHELSPEGIPSTKRQYNAHPFGSKQLPLP